MTFVFGTFVGPACLLICLAYSIVICFRHFCWFFKVVNLSIMSMFSLIS